jgi:hypothetical protein
MTGSGLIVRKGSVLVIAGQMHEPGTPGRPILLMPRKAVHGLRRDFVPDVGCALHRWTRLKHEDSEAVERWISCQHESHDADARWLSWYRTDNTADNGPSFPRRKPVNTSASPDEAEQAKKAPGRQGSNRSPGAAKVPARALVPAARRQAFASSGNKPE